MVMENRKALVSSLLKKLQQIEEILASVKAGVKELQEEVPVDRQLNLELDSEPDLTTMVLPPSLSNIPSDVIKLVDRSIVTLYNVIPVGEENGVLVVASYIDNEKNNIPGLSIVLGRSISVISVGEDEFLCARRKYYPSDVDEYYYPYP